MCRSSIMTHRISVLMQPHACSAMLHVHVDLCVRIINMCMYVVLVYPFVTLLGFGRTGNYSVHTSIIRYSSRSLLFANEVTDPEDEHRKTK